MYLNRGQTDPAYGHAIPGLQFGWNAACRDSNPRKRAARPRGELAQACDPTGFLDESGEHEQLANSNWQLAKRGAGLRRRETAKAESSST
jgi:hypothetical protein